MTVSRLGLFQGFGVELEYMIVDRATLDVRPVADAILRDEAGAIVSDITLGEISWSNELVSHVLEMKTEGPAKSLDHLAPLFQENVREANRRLESVGAMLLPTATHPWMNPDTETVLWQHEYNEVYEAYNCIFDCRGHGWSNLQSTHINLPFANDEEFGRLHAAIRIALPLIPALAASSPIMDGRRTGRMDSRLHVYQGNQARVPSIIGRVIPEPVYTEADYRREILERTYRDIAPFDADGLLQSEFLNSRGAIARFTRGAIEIRLVDIQECPAADLAIVQYLTTLVRALVEERIVSYEVQKSFPTDSLRTVLMAGIDEAEHAIIDDREYLALFGVTASPRKPVIDLLRAIHDELGVSKLYPASAQPLRTILGEGTLARRIVNSLRNDDSREAMTAVYRQLAKCLDRGVMFSGG
ncbi:glutamate--cysteine ligase [bacterium]|nr:glutamate--cysteine ligase [bacterium]